MNVYISSHDQQAARDLAKVLTDAGHVITSSWVAGTFARTATFTEDERREIAMRNFDEIDESQYLVLIACDDKVPGGKFVEAGMALGMGVSVLILGRRENMLLWLETIEQFDSAEEIAEYLTTVEAAGDYADPESIL